MLGGSHDILLPLVSPCKCGIVVCSIVLSNSFLLAFILNIKKTSTVYSRLSPRAKLQKEIFCWRLICGLI